MSIVPYQIIITQTSDNTAVSEGGATYTYTLVLTYAPTADVVITLGNTNKQVNTDFTTLTFTTDNWNVAQTVTVTAVNDTVGEGMHHGVIQHTVTSTDGNYSGMVIDNVIVVITDNDLPVGNPVFDGPTSNSLSLIYVGGKTVPIFVDIDRDGDLDAFIGNENGNTLFYKNTGTASLAAFAAPITNEFGLTDVGSFAAPSLVDIDGDGDLDAFIGSSDGNTRFYQNNGTASFAAFAAPISNAFGLTNVGIYAMPSLVDIDGDGDLDAFIGNGAGNTLFYENTGTTTSAFFTAPITDAFGLADVGINAAPSFVDIDGDGDLDAFIGNSTGTLFYRNTGTASLPVFTVPMTNAFGLNNVGSFVAPTFVDIDGDGDLDAFIGNNPGNTLLFINNAAPTLTAFTSTLATGNEDSAITITFANLVTQGDEADSDGTVTAFAVQAITSGTLKIGVDAQTATAWNTATNYTIDATHLAYWTPAADANGTLNAFTVKAVDNLGAESATAIQTTVDVTPVNDVPTLTAFTSTLATGTEDTSITITVADLVAQGDQADSDGTVTAFVVNAITTGSLRIGADAASATAWDVSTNAIVDATHLAYWIPGANANGTLNAFTVTALDNQGAKSVTAIQTTVDVTAIPDVTLTTDLQPSEGGVAGTFTITLDSAAPAGGLVVNYRLSGSATALTDYSVTAGTNVTGIAAGSFTIAEGQTTATLLVNALSDAVIDPSETVTLAISTGTGYQFIGNATRFETPVSYGTDSGPYLVSVGDFNGDGFADLAVANVSSNTVSVLLGNGDGSFADKVDYATGTNPFSVSVGDVNGDGKLDMALANANSNNVSVLLGNGYGSFATKVDYATGVYPEAVSIGDFNGDGLADLAIANYSDSTMSVLLRNAANTGFYSKVDYGTGVAPQSVSIGDFNGDGYADLAIANTNSNNVSVLLGNGDGSFADKVDYATGIFPISVSIGDFNNDGYADLAVTNYSDGTVSVLLRNTDNSGFDAKVDYETGEYPGSVSIGDFNGDGKLDMVVANRGPDNTVSVFLNNGNGSFARKVDVATGAYSVSVSVGDFNGDGTPDLAIANNNANTVSVLLASNLLTASLTINDAPTLTAFTSTLVTGNEDTAITITLAQLTAQDNAADSDGTVTAFAVQAITSGTLKIGTSELNAADWNANNNYIIDASQFAYWTPNTNANGTLNAFTVKAVDNMGLQSTTAIQATVDVTPVNDVPTLIDFTSTLVTGNEDTAITITLAELTAQDNAADSDGTVTAFAVQAITSGTLKIGVDAQTAIVWNAETNYTIDATHLAYWTPDANANGILNAFTVKAVDNLGAESAIPVQATIAVTPVTDVTLTAGLQLNEGGTAGTFTITLDSAAPAGGLVVNYHLSGGATTLTDYSVTAGTNVDVLADGSFMITEGQITATLLVNALSDAVIDPLEIVTLNISAGTGYQFVGNVTTFTPTVDYGTGLMPISVSAGDFNGDGLADLAVANLGSSTVSVLLRNTANTGFDPKVDFATGITPFSVSVGDFNGDGKVDLAVANSSSNSVSVLLRKADNSGFDAKVDYTTGSTPQSVSIGDFNGDGKVDLAVANKNSNTVSVLLRNTANTGFDPKVDFATGITPFSVSVGDFNGDGKVDLAVANTDNDTVSVLLNNGDGSFAAKVDLSTGSRPQSVSIGDFNGDGFADLAVTNSNSNSVSVLLRKADNSGFDAKVDYGTGITPSSVSIGDFNGDGFTDLAVTNSNSNNVSVLLGNGNGSFDAKVDYANSSASYSAGTGDFNGDGKLDLAVANSGSGSVSVLLASNLLTASLTINDAPTLTDFTSTLATGNEDTAITITLAELTAKGNEYDSDGTVTAFAVQAITSGTLKIGTSELNAANWNANNNYIIDASQFAYWTPDVNANGILNAFTVKAVDNLGLQSSTAIQATVNVVNLNNNAPVFTSSAIGSVNENALIDTVIYTAVTTDADNLLPVTYSLGGDDQDLLAINAETGAVTLKASANFEAKAGYNFNVIASDGSNTSTQAVVVSVLNLNDNAPVFTSGATGTVNENALISTVIYTATTTDADNLAARTYTLGGADLDLLAINTATGAVTLKASANFEAKANYNFEVIANDGSNTTTQAVVVSVLNQNDNAPVFTSGATGTVNENGLISTVIYTAATTDADNLSARTYTLGGADLDLLVINATTGVVTLKAAADFEAKAGYNFNVIASDGSNTTTQAVVVSVLNLNDNAPVFTSGATGTVNENGLISTVIYTAATTDADNLSAASYSLGGTDLALLAINAATGAVTLKEAADFEAKAGYNFNVIASDGSNTTTQAVVMSVLNLNDNAPVFTSGATGTVNENALISTVIYTATTTDADNLAARTYTLGGADLDLLAINAATGTVTLKEAADFEAKAVYNFDVIASDGSNTTTQAVVVSVLNLNDNAPVFTSGATGTVNENALISTVIYTAATTDADNLAARTYTLGGANRALLAIDAVSGVVTLLAAADFEAKAGYNFNVIASDGSNTTTQAVVVSVLNLNDNAPVFTSGATGTVNENVLISTVIYTAATTDADNLAARTYTLGGADRALLAIDAVSGVVTLLATADFEAKAGYNFNVIASDGSNTTTQAVVVSVLNLNDNAPVFTSGATGTVNENALISTVIYTATTTDADNLAARTYTLGGADLALLVINATTGAVTLKAAADFEAKAGYNFDVIASDGSNTTTQAVVVSVLNLNDNAPVFTSGATGTVNENALISTVIYTAATTDADNLAARTYTLGGADRALLAIDAVSGVVTLLATADFEAKAGYNFNVIASDGSNTTTQAVVVSVLNLNDNAPVFTSGATGTVNENALISTVIYTAATTDADNLSASTYSLGGADLALLDINATTGVVTLKAVADFEAKAGYNFNVIASDGSNTTTQAVVVSVLNLNDNAPVFTSGATGTVNENALISTVIYTATTTDADNLSASTYSLGGADLDLLVINATTGVVTLKAAADFEAKAGYNFNVIASDGSNTTTQAVVVSVLNLNDKAPVFTSGATGSVNENALISTVIYTAATTDADNLAARTYTLGGADLDLLVINATTGVVTLKAAADFEAKAGYNFNVIASDGSNTTTQAVVVSVLNLNDNAPTGLVTITGTATQNQILNAANTLTDADGLGIIAYQWLANGTAINGATAETFTLDQGQVSQVITVQASYVDGAGALEMVTSAASANVTAVQMDTAGNDAFVGSNDNSTVQYDFSQADAATNITRVGLSSDGKTVVLMGIDGTDTLTNIQTLVFGNDILSLADFLKTVSVTQLFDSLGNNTKTYVLPDLYTGSLDLNYQYVDESPNAVIIGADSSDFIKVAGSGNKAVNSGTGNDVIDGATGSSFLTGGEGNDTVFLDGRMAGTSWSTLTDFQQGQDRATIFGWVNGVSKVAAFSNTDGAEGYTGLTLHLQNLLPDGSVAGTTNPALNSLTLTGHTLAGFGASSLADLNNQIASGTNTHFLTGQTTDSFGSHGYLYIS
ncbi:FG-GAP-like repeat-containing protein [Methylobacter psychrophilus]|uniref:FG-GAP-like repeat-containing protein n=1 Tax=Methylobacter psychrophilus TaxID=96941 RepID=UPI0021D4ECB3|nr:FG-GAP-like repeat-containing protein [Methylobacter psychrophilus]